VERMDRQAAPRGDAEDLGEMFCTCSRARQPHDLMVNVVLEQVLMDVERTQHVDLAHEQHPVGTAGPTLGGFPVERKPLESMWVYRMGPVIGNLYS
jgi:hypothetical protein